MEKANSTTKDINRLIHRKVFSPVAVLSLGGLLFLVPLVIGMAVYFMGLEFNTIISWAFVITMGLGVVTFIGGVGLWVSSRLAYKNQIRKLKKSSKDTVVDTLIQRLQKKDFGPNQTVITILGDLEDKKATLPLIETLKDDNALVRWESADALCKIKDKRAIEGLLMALKDIAYPVRATAAKALEKINWQPDSVEEKIDYYISRGKWNEIVKLGDAAIDPVIEFLGNEGNPWRLLAADTLGKIGDKRAIGPLTEALQDGDEYVRKYAKAALKRINRKNAAS